MRALARTVTRHLSPMSSLSRPQRPIRLRLSIRLRIRIRHRHRQPIPPTPPTRTQATGYTPPVDPASFSFLATTLLVAGFIASLAYFIDPLGLTSAKPQQSGRAAKGKAVEAQAGGAYAGASVALPSSRPPWFRTHGLVAELGIAAVAALLLGFGAFFTFLAAGICV